MRSFDPHAFDAARARIELAEFKALLDSHVNLKEREHVLAGFRRWPNLCALFGIFHGRISVADRIRLEFRIEGYFRTDLTVAKADTDSLCLVEFERALPNCIFKSGKRAVAGWASGFEKGFSQVVDWAWAIDEYRNTPPFVEAFGSNRPDFVSVLVIGRDSELSSPTAMARWKWRGRNVSVGGRPTTLLTFDELHFHFDTELKSRP